MKNFVARLVREEEAQDLIEYALLMGLIALVCIGAIRAGGQTISGVWDNIRTQLNAVSASL